MPYAWRQSIGYRGFYRSKLVVCLYLLVSFVLNAGKLASAFTLGGTRGSLEFHEKSVITG